jgi:hypothetical protein
LKNLILKNKRFNNELYNYLVNNNKRSVLYKNNFIIFNKKLEIWQKYTIMTIQLKITGKFISKKLLKIKLFLFNIINPIKNFKLNPIEKHKIIVFLVI